MSELSYLRWLHAHLGQRGGRILVDSGDDCAVLKIGREQVLFKVDTVVERVHFRAGTPWKKVGAKAMGRPLSDIAAMGGIPTFALAAAVLNRRMTDADARAITLGLESHGIPLVGGDIKAHDGPCMISVTLLGEMRGAKPVLRRGAKAGDLLMVTGPLGASIRGHHLAFKPRLREGRAFATTHRVNAMIDISDGLVRDLGHLGVGADLMAEQIPCRSTLKRALYDGEDYELLVAASPAAARRIAKEGLARPIGLVSPRPGIRLIHAGGRVEKVENRGYEHHFGR